MNNEFKDAFKKVALVILNIDTLGELSWIQARYYDSPRIMWLVRRRRKQLRKI